jgi:alkylhydroperoxidase family enzyme
VATQAKGSKLRVPLVEIDASNKKRLQELGGEFLNLYKVIGNNPPMLSASIEFAYTIRRDCATSRSLRELMILRGAQIVGSGYEWQQHRRWAKKEGVTQEQIEDLFMWREFPQYSEAERAALALTEAIMEGDVSDEVYAGYKRSSIQARSWSSYSRPPFTRWCRGC